MTSVSEEAYNLSLYVNGCGFHRPRLNFKMCNSKANWQICLHGPTQLGSKVIYQYTNNHCVNKNEILFITMHTRLEYWMHNWFVIKFYKVCIYCLLLFSEKQIEPTDIYHQNLQCFYNRILLFILTHVVIKWIKVICLLLYLVWCYLV